MIICDKCSKKIPRLSDRNERTLTIYSAAGAYIGRSLHLCDTCSRELDDYLGKAQSYFMATSERTSDIFKDAKYWTNKFDN